jgi:hypothetical protein
VVVAALLDDITARAPHRINGAPAGLAKLTRRKMPVGTVLSRAQLQRAREGSWLTLVVDDDDTDDNSTGTEDDDE